MLGLQILPQRELNRRKGYLAHDSDAETSVQPSGRCGAQGSPRGRVLPSLRAGLYHFGRHPDEAGRHLADRGSRQVDDRGRHLRIARQDAFEGIVGREKRRRAWRRAERDGADARVDGAEPARREKAARRL